MVRILCSTKWCGHLYSAIFPAPGGELKVRRNPENVRQVPVLLYHLLPAGAASERVHDGSVQELAPQPADRADPIWEATGSDPAAGRLQIPQTHRSVPGRPVRHAANQDE